MNLECGVERPAGLLEQADEVVGERAHEQCAVLMQHRNTDLLRIQDAQERIERTVFMACTVKPVRSSVRMARRYRYLASSVS